MRTLEIRGRSTHRNIHLAALALALIALPWSEFLLSLAQIILVVNWIWEGIAHRDLGGRFKRSFTTAESAVFISFFGLHALGLLWTSDMKWGLDLCRILLPVLVFAAVLSSVPRLTAAELKTLLLLGAWSAAASTVVCLVLRYDVLAVGHYRQLSPFISHIRLSLILCWSIVLFAFYWPQRMSWRIAHLAAILMCLWFLDLLSSLTAPVILPVVAVYFLWRWAKRRSASHRAIAWATLLIALAGTGLFLRSCIVDYRAADPTDLEHLEVFSAGGEMYYHDLKDPQRENGHYVWIDVADKELERGWERLSDIPFSGKDKQGQPMRSTLIRYLASMGQVKDSVGLLALSPSDVARIEEGVTSVVEGRNGALRSRIEQVLYEFDSYRVSGDPSGHSVTMRMEFVRTGLHIAKAHWLTGVGTGDTQQEFDTAFERYDSPLGTHWRLRAHNEYLTLLISFGLFGLLWSLFSWWWPAYRLKAFDRPLFVAWAIIFLLSCFSEDTLETQMGATFFALYYALFVFAAPLGSESSA